MFKRTTFLNLLPYLFVFISSLYRPFDSDLGWHLKYGEYFFQHFQILRQNTYSTEMAGFAWPNTNWLTDVITYAIYSTGGFVGLSVTAALIIVLTFWVFAKAFDLDLFQKAFIFPVLLALEAPVNEVSFRGQLISNLFLAVLFLFLEKFSFKKQLIFIPLLFVVWVNTHGQFILGLGILALYIGFKILESAFTKNLSLSFSVIINAIKNTRYLLMIWVFSMIAGFVNPFGSATYQIALSHFNSPELKYIIEYLPVEDLSDDWWKQMVFGIMLFFGLLYVIFSGKVKENIAKTGIVSIFFLLALLVRRYAWSMYYLGIPLLKPLANFVKPDSERNAIRAAIVLFIFYISCALYLKMPLTQFTKMNWQAYCEDFNNCSEGSIQYAVANHLSEKNMMTMYNWGGYMIWMHPEIKPSIDGRMTVWKDPATGYSPLADYYAYETNSKDINDSKYDVVLMGNEKEIYNRLNKLVKEGKWEKKYEDQYGGVFVRSTEATKSTEFILN